MHLFASILTWQFLISSFSVKVPLEHVGKEYTTDSGFIVPAISSELRKKVFARAGNLVLYFDAMRDLPCDPKPVWP